jgi:hypothetical protein
LLRVATETQPSAVDPTRAQELVQGTAAESIIFAAATKLRHALSLPRKSLTSQLKSRLSLQSIMGAMQQRRSKSFITNWFLTMVSVVDDWTDWHCRRKKLNVPDLQ